MTQDFSTTHYKSEEADGHKNAQKATINSPNVIHRHYKGLVEEADADEYWTTPKSVKSRIVKLPAQAAD